MQISWDRNKRLNMKEEKAQTWSKLEDIAIWLKQRGAWEQQQQQQRQS